MSTPPLRLTREPDRILEIAQPPPPEDKTRQAEPDRAPVDSSGLKLVGPTGRLADTHLKAEGTLARTDPAKSGPQVEFGKGSVESGRGSVRVEGTLVDGSTGDSNKTDFGAKLFDAGGEVTVRVTREEGRIGAGYRANLIEINGSIGEMSDKSQDDCRASARVSAGVTSGGVFVSWNDRDRDGKTNFKIEVDLPIGATPFGAGGTLETERPLQDGAAALMLLNPTTVIPAANYLIRRMVKP